MDELKELVSLISRQKIKQIDIWNNSNGSTTQVQELYDLLLTERDADEDVLIDRFYGDARHGRKYFGRLKRLLKSKLINALFFINVSEPNYADIQRAYYNCYKNAAATKIMIGRYVRLPARELAEQTIAIAKRFEFTDIVLSLSRDLAIHYSIHELSRKKARHYQKLAQRAMQQLEAEVLAERYYTELAVHFVHSRATKKQYLEKAVQYADELETIIEENASYRFLLYAFNVLILRYEIANDYDGVMRICRRGLDYFIKQSHLASNSVLWSFNFKILACQIQLGQYQGAWQSLATCLELAPHGSGNWFATKEYEMMLGFHSEDYQAAYRAYLDAIQHPSLKKQPPRVREPILVHEAFIHYLIELGMISPDPPPPARSFRLNRFLNQIPAFARDKRGTNASILILQILFFLQQGKLGEIHDRMDRLKMYAYRHLKRGATQRSNCFIKMLLELPANHFHRTAVERHTQRYLKLLHRMPKDMTDQNVEMEIIPFEKLWDLVLDSIEHQE